jgi:hypothetical protein
VISPADTTEFSEGSNPKENMTNGEDDTIMNCTNNKRGTFNQNG